MTLVTSHRDFGPHVSDGAITGEISEEALIPGVFVGSPAAAPRTLVDILDVSIRTYSHTPALDDGDSVLTYASLDARVGTLVRRLHSLGIGVGDRVGIYMPSGNADLYVGILAVLVAGAAYVPVDADDPPDRAELVWSEARVCAVLDAGGVLRQRPEVCPLGRCGRPGLDDDAWIIFTSGSTGKPKGVAITHRSAAAFVDAEALLFCAERPLGPSDRVLAGLSVAFDASCEEMWLAWRHGACLTPAPRALVRTGADLGPWLIERRVSVVSTVPTLAALLPGDALELVRLLIFGGEAVPAELAGRFVRPGRQVWNTYGPTEATVVTCASLLDGGHPVRIGLPLAGWSVSVVDTTGAPVESGEVGELVISGVGLGRYLDAAKDAQMYAPLPSLGWDRAYRSGDLVRADPAGLVFVGRADDQVKLAGRRVELGEIDAALQRLPGVAAAAAAVRRTPAGNPVLVGYLVPVPGTDVDPVATRALLSGQLPAQLVPTLLVLDQLPVRASGKVDRAALPWPAPADTTSGTAARLDGELEWLAQQWTDQLGPVPITADSDFFFLGGTSLAAAQLVTVLRGRYPSASVADIYRHPTLGDLNCRLGQLDSARDTVRAVRPTSRRAGAAQAAIMLVLFTLTGLRAVTGLAIFGKFVGGGTWMPDFSWPLILIAWLVLFSLPGRFVTAIVGVRVLVRSVRPGAYPRGGSVHLRLWAAERLVAACHLQSFTGTPWAGWYARALRCDVGDNVVLHSLPPVTGLASFGTGCAVESEVDLAGWWLDGDVLHLGEMRIGPGARVGTRVTLLPGADVGENAEVVPGACITGRVPAGEKWAGAEARRVGAAGEGWPAPRCPDGGRHRRRRPGGGLSHSWGLVYALSLVGLNLLSLIAAVPALALLLLYIRDTSTLQAAMYRALICVPPLVVLALCTYMALVAGLVRWAGRGLRPGFYPTWGRVGWSVWLIEGLLTGAQTAIFPVYASLLTPVWLRLLGARVGRGVEASTVLLLPQLSSFSDHSFLADHTLIAPRRLRGGWLHLDMAHVGERSFVGNSAIVGGGRSVPDHSLIGVLSDAPVQAEAGSSWLGQPPLELRRQAERGDPARTFTPPRRLKIARGAVELCRIVPALMSAVLGLLTIATLALIYVHAGGLTCVALSGPVLLAGGMIAGALTAGVKWLLMGRFSPGEHPLWSSFVWRNELADCFTEVLAVPWLVGSSLGTPLLNLWFRCMGAQVGRGVWCETWWLPEFDLVRLDDGVSVNRGTVLQTHLFHDRIMRLDRVHLAAGSTLGPRGIVLPGATLGAQVTVAATSLVMRGETVPPNTRWLGNPISVWPALCAPSGR